MKAFPYKSEKPDPNYVAESRFSNLCHPPYPSSGAVDEGRGMVFCNTHKFAVHGFNDHVTQAEE